MPPVPSFYFSSANIKDFMNKKFELDPKVCTTLVVPAHLALAEADGAVRVKRSEVMAKDSPPVFFVVLQLETGLERIGYVLRDQLLATKVPMTALELPLFPHWCSKTMPTKLNTIQPTPTLSTTLTLDHVIAAAPACIKNIMTTLTASIHQPDLDKVLDTLVTEDRLATIIGFLVCMKSIPWSELEAKLAPVFAHAYPKGNSALDWLKTWEGRWKFLEEKGTEQPRGCRKLLECKLCPYSSDLKLSHKLCGDVYQKTTNVLEFNMNTLTTVSYTKSVLSVSNSLDW